MNNENTKEMRIDKPIVLPENKRSSAESHVFFFFFFFFIMPQYLGFLITWMFKWINNCLLFRRTRRIMGNGGKGNTNIY
ncbi:hypothetical protein H8356DRAFT_1430161 [Neocallimastix lanati (nom. inval.)]|nr:hypothetical protein H8356DRAFT_1430161 [Neocallimastix sp. JGI-2020a]